MKPINILPISATLKAIGKPIAYYPNIAKALGSLKSAIFLCQFLYWEGKQNSKEGWIYKTQEEIWNETGLSRYEQETARKQLKELCILEEKYSGIPRKLYFKFNWQKLDEILSQQHTIMPENNIQGCENPADSYAGIQQTITENTQEITTETTSSYLKEDDERQEIIDNVNDLEWLRQKFRFYFGRDTLTPFENYKFKEMLDKYSREKLEDAFEKAKLQNKMSIAYIEAILNNNGKKKASIWDD